MSNENFPIQGHDWRKNSEKPLATFQESYPITLADGSDMQVLCVHLSEDPTSPAYFCGVPDAYLGGAVYQDNKADDVVDNPGTEIKEEAAELE